MSACNCCEAFPIDVVNIQARSRSAETGYCAFFNEGDGKFYKIRTETYEDPWEGEPGWLGSGTIVVTFTKEFDLENNQCTETIEYTPDITGGTQYFQPPYDDGSTFANLLSTQYSDEETEQDVKDRLLLLLDAVAWSDWEDTTGLGGNAPATANGPYIVLGEEADQFFATESEVRITHPPTATGHLKVWLVRRDTTWDETEETWINPEESPFEIYEWTGGPASENHGINEEENKVTSDPFAIAVDSGQRAEIFLSKWSLVDGYTPDDPESVDPYPQTTRPDPDCESNGVPTLSAQCGFRP